MCQSRDYIVGKYITSDLLAKQFGVTPYDLYGLKETDIVSSAADFKIAISNVEEGKGVWTVCFRKKANLVDSRERNCSHRGSN